MVSEPLEKLNSNSGAAYLPADALWLTEMVAGASTKSTVMVDGMVVEVAVVPVVPVPVVLVPVVLVVPEPAVRPIPFVLDVIVMMPEQSELTV